MAPAAPKPTVPPRPTAGVTSSVTPYNPTGPAVPRVSYAPVKPPPMTGRPVTAGANQMESILPQQPNKSPITPKDPSGGRGTIPPPVGGRGGGPVRYDPRPRPPAPQTPPPTKIPGDPNDPTRGRGTIPPPVGRPDHTAINKIRQSETPEERLERLQAMRRAGNDSRNLTPRIKELKNTDLDKDKPFKKQRPPKPVQLDDKPETWPDQDHKRRNRNQSESLAELALPRGMDTMFYDNPAGDEQNKEAVKQRQGLQKDLAKEREAVNKPDNKQDDKNNETRGEENLQQRRNRLKAALAKLKPTDPKYAQLKARIADLEKRIKAGDTKGRNKNQPGTPKRPYKNREVSYRPLGYGGTLRI
jgi:hypothetical protein